MATNTIFSYLTSVGSLTNTTASGATATGIPGVDASLLNYFNTAATGVNLTAATGNSATQSASTNPSATLTGTQSDYRLRLAHLSGYSNPYPGILAPLAATQGLMFPYTPTIAFTQEVDYANMQMTHSNTDYYSFTRSPNTSLSINAKFSVQNQTEGQYVTAALMFLKSVSKMNFGQNDANAGLPPPILTLNGYGTYNFNKVRVFLKNHSYSYEEGMDLVKVTVGSGFMMLPALFTVSLSLTSQQTPRAMRQDFTLDSYRDGTLLAKGGWI
jgi:hypothetical protein